jgi:hypothetical protein
LRHQWWWGWARTVAAGERLFVDYAGDGVPVVIDRLIGEIRKAQIFVAVLGVRHISLILHIYLAKRELYPPFLPPWGNLTAGHRPAPAQSGRRRVSHKNHGAK